MVRTAPITLPALLLVLAGCASGPPPAPAPPAPLVPPDGPGAVVEISLKPSGWLPTRTPDQVWFARVAGLNGSDCAPREARFDPALDRTTVLGGGEGGGLAMMGTMEGGGIPGDPTCLYDETGAPIWDPILYPATRIEGTRAYLDAPPPARYVVVAATFGTGDDTTTVYFSEAMIAGTEVPLPPGAARHMGRYVLGHGSGDMDPAQSRFRARLSAGDPSTAAVIVQGVIAALAGADDSHAPSHVHHGAIVREAVLAPAPDSPPVYPW